MWQRVAVQTTTLLDGGLGQEVLRHAKGDVTPLWSTQVMIDEPELVRRVHGDFIEAGADVITVNTYSATRVRLEQAGLGHEYERLQRLAGELAVEAREQHGRAGVRIAGCLSPYGWSYRPELALPYDELWPLYAEDTELQAPFVDVMLCETMGSIDESRAAARGAAHAGAPVWMAWTIRDDDTACLRSGEPLADAIRAVADDPAAPVDAILVNCSQPEAIDAAIPVLAGAGIPFGAYANGFRNSVEDYAPGSVVTVLTSRDDLDPAAYADTVDGWLAAGATIVGGCCEIGPEHIAEIRRRLDARPLSVS